VAVRGAGIGLAIKMQSGRNEWSHAVAIEALRQLDLLTASDIDAFGELAHPVVRNHRRLRVGDVRPTFTLCT